MMRLPPFRYHAPTRATEVATILHQEGPEAMIVAGGTDLYPNMKRRHQMPKTLVSLRRVDALRGVSINGAVTLGAGETLRSLERNAALKERLPALWTAVNEHQHADPAQHGHDRRQRLPRHALQLLQPELGVAPRHRLLPQVRGGHLLDCPVEPDLLGGELLGHAFPC